MPATISLEQPSQSQTWDISERPTFKIGRSQDNDLILDQSWISRRHAIIQQEKNKHFHIIDVGSANGTFINGKRIVTQQTLHSGDQIMLGKTCLTFTDSTPPLAVGEETMDKDLTIAVVARQQTTIVICDIHRFTELSETIGNAQLSDMLQRWTRLTSTVISRFGGQIDKFIGDAVLAYWPTSDEGTAQLIKPLQATMNIYQESLELGRRLSLPWDLDIGGAMNFGETMMGNIGVDGGRDFTIIGDAVNVAFRLESKTQQGVRELILGQSAYDHLPQGKDLFTPHQFQLQGKTNEVCGYGTTFSKLKELLDNFQ